MCTELFNFSVILPIGTVNVQLTYSIYRLTVGPQYWNASTHSPTLCSPNTTPQIQVRALEGFKFLYVTAPQYFWSLNKFKHSKVFISERKCFQKKVCKSSRVCCVILDTVMNWSCDLWSVLNSVLHEVILELHKYCKIYAIERLLFISRSQFRSDHDHVQHERKYV